MAVEGQRLASGGYGASARRTSSRLPQTRYMRDPPLGTCSSGLVSEWHPPGMVARADTQLSGGHLYEACQHLCWRALQVVYCDAYRPDAMDHRARFGRGLVVAVNQLRGPSRNGHRRTKAQTTRIMRTVHSSGTGPEVALELALQGEGIAFETQASFLPGRPDIVIPGQKLALFVDGDFWHGGQWRQRGLRSLEDQFSAQKGGAYWLKKIRGNVDRDLRSTASLLREGWNVMRFWASDIQRAPSACVSVVKTALSIGPSPPEISRIPERTVAEFFAGIGLMRGGLEGAGWKVKFANDIDPLKLEMYRANFSSGDVVLEDIRRLRGSQIPAVTLATGSFPCNDLSVAGARAGLSGKQSSLFWELIRLLDEMGTNRPPLVLLENVIGFLRSHGGGDLEEALRALGRLGYSVDAFVVNASDFVPQSRPRLFIVGARAAPPEPARTMVDLVYRPPPLSSFVASHPELPWRLRPLPLIDARVPSLQTLLDDLPEDAPGWWSEERVQYLYNQMSPRHQESARRMVNGRQWSYGTVFRRVRNGRSMAELRTDGIAGCLRTPRGGSGRQILFSAGNGKMRARLLTGNECARLMGANDYKIGVPLNQALFGFGDAVCVPVVRWIAANYLNPLASELIRGVPLRPL